MLGLVDIAVAGRIGEAVYIAAIAVGGTMFNLLYWMFNFLRMGTGGLTAQACGADDMERATLVLVRSAIVAGLVGLTILLTGGPLAALILDFLKPDSVTVALARRYFAVGVFGAPAVMLTYTLSGWFIGMQNSRVPMWMAILTNVVNIILSPLLVFRFDMSIEGIAVATVVGQWAGVLFGAVVLSRCYVLRRCHWRHIVKASELSRFFRINTDIFLRTGCLVAVTLWFTHTGAMQGADILAANALLLQLFMLTSFFMDGIAFAGEALAGKYMGCGDMSGLRTLVTSLIRLALLCALFFSLIFACGGRTLLSLLADNGGVVESAMEYLPWAVAIPLCGFSAFVFDGVFIGLTLTRSMLAAMAVAAAVFFAISIGLFPSLANNALWLAFDVYLLIRGLMECILMKIFVNKMNIY